MEKTKITYQITDALQRSEIAAERDGKSKREVEVDLVSMLSDTEHTKIQNDGTIWIETHRGRNWNELTTPQSTLLTPDTGLEALKKEIADGIAEDEAAIIAYLSLLDDKKIDDKSFTDWRVYTYNQPCENDARVKAEVTRLLKICEEHNVVIKKIRDEAQVEKEKEAAARAKLKTEQLADAVARLGTDLQKEKWAAGVMAHSEALNLIRAEIFGKIPGVVHGNNFLLPKETDEYGEEIEISSTEKTTLTDEQFAKAKEISALVPGAKALYYHEYYENHDDMDTVDLIMLTKKIGEYTISCQVIL